MSVTVVIPTHPPRNRRQLARAVASVGAQTVQPDAIVIANDLDRAGSAATRNRALGLATTEWVAFLDSDDQLLPNHLEKLLAHAADHDADVVYSLPLIVDADGNELPRRWDYGGGPTFDPVMLEQKAYIQTTSLVRREAALAVGGFEFHVDSTGAPNDDHGFYLKLLHAGYRFAHLHEPTFTWKHWGRSAPGRDGNTSGRGDVW